MDKPYFKKTYFVQVGDVVSTKNDNRLVTVLGSCVALTFYVPRLKFGIMLHAILPENVSTFGRLRLSANENKYLNKAFETALKILKEKKVMFDEVQVKLFGGASIISQTEKKAPVGIQNVNMAKKLLKMYEIKILAEDTGDFFGRRVEFYLATGDVFVRKVLSESEMQCKKRPVCSTDCRKCEFRLKEK